MNRTGAKIWVDLDNSPHVPFFAPIVEELRRRGYRVCVSVSGRYQVRELAAMHRIPHVVFGAGYYGRSKGLKTAGIVLRALRMLPFAWKEKPALALSHGSRSQMVAANLLNMPVVLILDYEHARFPFIKLDCLIAPEVVGESPSDAPRVWKYPGIKEDVYVPLFKPSPGVLEELGITAGEIVVTLRPPATDAHYHNAESEVLFRRVVEFVAGRKETVMVLLPRSREQEEAIRAEWRGLVAGRRIIIPQRALSGLDLLWHSDLVISGGGTMNREGAALGIPVYSIFRGELGAVDRFLAERKRLTLIGNAEDIPRLIRLEKRRGTPPRPGEGNDFILKLVVDRIESVIPA